MHRAAQLHCVRLPQQVSPFEKTLDALIEMRSSVVAIGIVPCYRNMLLPRVDAL